MYQNEYPAYEGWPSNQQELLLKIALSDPDEAYGMWQKNRLCLVPGDVEVSSRFILPLVYQNLMGYHSKIDPSTLDYFRNLFLRTHAENTRRLLVMEPLAKAFQNAGLQLTLLKGLAMLLLYYKNEGLRPMSDVDIFIPFEKIDIVLGLLNSLGWQPKSGDPKRFIESYFKWGHGYEFYNAEGQWIDLHWHIMPECCYAEADDDLSQGAVELDYKGIRFSALNPADQLLHAFVQGARCEGFVYLRWVADAAKVIQHAGVDVDWQRLASLAKKYRLVLQVRNALAYMKERIGIPVPGKVFEELQSLPVTKTEQFEYHYKRQRIDNKLFSYWPVLWFDYSRQLYNVHFIRKMIGFPEFLRDYWGIENFKVLADLFRTMMGKMFANLRHRQG
jgi:hypothetical protein